MYQGIDFESQARELQKTVCLAEAAKDPRTMQAATALVKKKLVTPLLIGARGDLQKDADAAGLDLDLVQCVDPFNYDGFDEIVEIYRTRRAKENLSVEAASELLRDSVFFGAMLVATGRADGMVAGAIHSTTHVGRAAIKCVGPKPGIRTISSCFLMFLPESQAGPPRKVVFSDCALLPEPTPDQLVDIGESAAESCRVLLQQEPIIAFLSFSTKGSANHPSAKKMANAAKALSEKYPELIIDGEMQFDAAMIPGIGQSKCPESPIQGQANVLVFPNLESGNIGYKITERLAGAKAIGMVSQGLAKPINDMSRGCSTQDIIDVACITAIQAKSTQ